MKNFLIFLLLIVSIILGVYNLSLNRENVDNANPQTVLEDWDKSTQQTIPEDVAKSNSKTKDKSFLTQKDILQLLKDIKIRKLNIKNESMERVVYAIEEEILSYNNNIASQGKVKLVLCKNDIQVEDISINASNISIKEILDKLTSQYGYMYYVEDSKVYLRIKASTARKIRQENRLKQIEQKQLKEKEDLPKESVADVPSKKENISSTLSTAKTEESPKKSKALELQETIESISEEENTNIRKFIDRSSSEIHRKYMINLNMDQKVNRLYSGEGGSNNSTNVRKEITVFVKSFVPLDIIVCYFCNIASEYKSLTHLKYNFFEGYVDKENPYIFRFSDVTPAYRNYDYLNYRKSYGNAKMQSAVFIYEKVSGELIGKRGTKDNFLRYIEKVKKQEMLDFVKSVRIGSDSEHGNCSVEIDEKSKTSVQKDGRSDVFRIKNLPVIVSDYPISINKSLFYPCFVFAYFVYLTEDNNIYVVKKIVYVRNNSCRFQVKPNQKLLDAGVLIFDSMSKKIAFEKHHKNPNLLNYMRDKYASQIERYIDVFYDDKNSY